MGIPGLLKACKIGCSTEIDLTHGGKDSIIIVDGGYLLHKLVCLPGVASAIMDDDNLRPLAAACIKFVHSLEDAGWKVLVLFDGASPPAKAVTAQDRREKRERAAACHAKAAKPSSEREKYAKQAAPISARLRARIGRILQLSCACEAVFAPFEADAQLVYMEAEFVRAGQRCFVYATDADLIVIGVQNLAWDIKISSRGCVTAQVISREALLNPSPQTLEDRAKGKFLRQLHGVPEGCDNPQAQPAAVANARLLDFGCLAGNDYVQFKGLEFGTAVKSALPPIMLSECVRDDEQVMEVLVEAAATKLIVANLAADGPDARERAREGIQTSFMMFQNSVVFNNHTGQQERHHPLRDTSTEAEARAALSTGESSRLHRSIIFQYTIGRIKYPTRNTRDYII